MNERLQTAARGRLWTMLIASAILVIGGSTAIAQRFQYDYGGPNCNEAGRGGVLQASRGGYLTVGESYSVNAACNGSDIYVVRTNNDGSLAWSRRYSIGLFDSALDVEEVFSSCPGIMPGGFIITGVTDNQNQPACPPNRNAFLLRIDDCGNVQWVNTYGSPASDEIGWNVDVAMSGTASWGTNAGDFIVSGSSNSNGPGGPRDGYIFRTDCRGNLIWANTYGSQVATGDDYFYGVTETQQPVPAGQPGSNPPLGSGTFDIVACGGSNGFCNTTTYDAWIVRVDGNTGAIGAAPQNSTTYGGISGFDRDDDLRSVEELQIAPNNSNLVFTGRTSSSSPPVPPLPNMDVYVLQTWADPCVFVGDQAFGDMWVDPDEGYWIREVQNNVCPTAPAGSLVITGYLTPPAGGFGGADVFVHLCGPGPGFPVIGTEIYGGTGADWGWSVSPVQPNPATCYTPGYIVSGFTQSFPTTAPQQLYLIKTDCALDAFCNSRSYRPNFWIPGLMPCCQPPTVTPLLQWCWPSISCVSEFWQDRLCYIADGTGFCAAPVCQPCGLVVPPKAPVHGDEISDNLITFEETGTVSSYPNPVRSGSDLNLEYTLTHDALASMTIVDIAGKTVYEKTEALSGGSSVLTVSTEGWASGSYVINVTIGKISQSKRIVVIDGK